MPSIHVEPGTVALYGDVTCGWATLAVHRFRAARRRLGLEGGVHLDHRLFALEEVNRSPVEKRVIDAEIAVLGTLAPELGFRIWQDDPSTWPVSSLLAAEAVHAAKEQGPEASEELDVALRAAFFREGRCITLLHEVLDVAERCEPVDAGALRASLEDGRARGPMLRQFRADAEHVQGSPHLFLPDGSGVHNPGLELHWEGEPGTGFPVVDRDDRSVYDDLLHRATGRVTAE